MSKRSTRRRGASQSGSTRRRSHLRATPSMLKSKHPSGNVGKRLLLTLVAVLGVFVTLCGAAGMAVGITYSNIASDLKPRLDTLQTYQAFASSRIYDRNGTLLYEFIGTGRRDPVALDEIAPELIQATIDIEDATFYENSGVNYLSIARATYANLTQQDVGAGGASTITQQLVRAVILTTEEREEENTYKRKLKEIVLAQELNNQYSKDEVLQLYLNEIPYGNLSYGIQAAARSYFGVDAKNLSTSQATLLAGIPQLPTYYNPLQYVDESRVLPGVRLPKNDWLSPVYDLATLPGLANATPTKYRQIDVLRRMVTQGHLTERQARAIASEDLQFAPQEVSLLAPHFVFYVQDYLEKRYGAQLVTEGGLSITTTLDLDMQNMAQAVSYQRIQELNADQRNIHNAAVVMMQPNTGQILAMVGSIGYNLTETTTTPGEEGNVLDGKVNVTTRQRQPGSALKPFTYMSGFEQYMQTGGATGLTPGSVIWDVPTIFNPGPNEYAPENYDQKAHGPLRPRIAVANSLNIPAVKALKAAGIQPTLDLLHRLGIAPSSLANSPDYYGLALTLGGGEVTPLDLATAYNTVASGGRYFAPTPILKITKANGDVLEEFDSAPAQASIAARAVVPGTDTSACVVPSAEDYSLGKRVPNGTQCVDARLAFLITNMISDNEARRPIFGSNSVLALSQPAAVKTGTTNDFRDAWASGFTPYLTVTVWTGNNNNEKTANVESTVGGGTIWNRIMEAVFANPQMLQKLAQPYGNLDAMPRSFLGSFPGIVAQSVCEIPGSFGGRSTELFVEGMVSKGQNCDLYTKATVVRLPSAEGEGARYCKPFAGDTYPEGTLVTVYVWNTPKSTDEEKIDFSKWKGFTSSDGKDTNTVIGLDVNSLPICDASSFATPTPETTPTPQVPPTPVLQPGQITMPDLRGLGENQAKQRLISLGINPNKIVVDYQGRDRLGATFDQYPAYAVISSLPGPGTVINASTDVVLGVRAPDAAPAPAPEPTTAPPAPQPTAAPPAPQPTAGPPPAPLPTVGP